MNSHQLRDELLELETISPSLRQEYQEKLKGMIEKRLKTWDRVAWSIAAVMGLGFLILFGTLAVVTGGSLPWLGRIGFGLGSLFGAVWMILSITILKKGSYNLRKDSFALSGAAWTFLVLMCTLSLLKGSQTADTAKGVLTVVSSLTFLVLFGLPLTWWRISESELRVREKLLLLELQLSELSESNPEKKKTE